jgi:rsbT co-antagonist protein RsbR
LTTKQSSRIPDILERDGEEVLEEWLTEQASIGARPDLVKSSVQRSESTEFLRLFTLAVKNGNLSDIQSAGWESVRDFLANLSSARAKMGFTPSQTARFVLSLKSPLFKRLYQELSENEALADEIWTATVILDNLGLWTTEVFQKSREEVVQRQQLEMMELSTPVVKLWDGILALPLIGTLDSARTQVATESLLQAIVSTESEFAILDITGVPTVDTLVSQHLLKTVAAVRLMGADCIISGIRPQIAQTIVQLGVDLSQVTTRGSLSDAFALALRRTGRTISYQTQQKDRSGV